MSDFDFSDHCRAIAKRFLLTAVVVDDELTVGEPTAHGRLIAPSGGPGRAGRSAPKADDAGGSAPEADDIRPLNIDRITRSFSREGMVCGVISPDGDDEQALLQTIKRADIVILDWRIDRETGADSLELMKNILTCRPEQQLRFIAFYTGEPDRTSVRNRIKECLDTLDPKCAEESGVITFGGCRIVIYGKPGGLSEPNATDLIEPDELASRVIADFAETVRGLLPTLVVALLGTVRANVHRVLRIFPAQLDPAYLTHRAFLPVGSEAQQHVVEQIASELKGILEEALAAQAPSPAGINAIEGWLQDRFADGPIDFGSNKKMDQERALEILSDGQNWEPLRKQGRDHKLLSQGFSQGQNHADQLDLELANVMSFRQVVNAARPRLLMGTVVRRSCDNAVLVCATPTCDSVRLDRTTSFLFIRADAGLQGPTLVVRSPNGEFEQVAAGTNPSGWCTVEFHPDEGSQCVLATDSPADSEGGFNFKDIEGQCYRWIGELKSECAQSIAHSVATRMSRVALNESEWLRKSARR